MPSSFILQQLDWNHGTLTAHFRAPTPFYGPETSFPGNIISFMPSVFHGMDIQLRLCNHPAVQTTIHGTSAVTPYVCRPQAKTTINIVALGPAAHVTRLPDAVANLPSISDDPTDTTEDPQFQSEYESALPNRVSAIDEKYSYSWDFTGAPPPVGIWINTPLRFNASLLLGNAVVKLRNLQISLGTVSRTTSLIVAVLAAASVLTQARGSRVGGYGGALRVVAILAAALALIAISLSIGYWISAAALMGLAWTLVILSLSNSRSATRLGLGMLFLLMAALMLTANMTSWRVLSEHPPAQLTLRVGVIYISTGIIALTATVIGIFMLVGRVVSVTELCLPAEAHSHRVPVLVGSLISFSVFAAGGSFVSSLTRNSPILMGRSDHPAWWEVVGWFSSLTIFLKIFTGSIVFVFLNLLAVAILGATWISRFDASRAAAEALTASPSGSRRYRLPWARRSSSFPVVTMVALLLALAAPWSDTGTVAFIVVIPVWLTQFIVLAPIIKRLLTRGSWSAPAVRNERKMLLRAIRRDPQTRNDGAFDYAEASRLLELGPTDIALSNSRIAASIAAVLSMVPVAYTVWTTIDVSRADTWPIAVFSIVSIAAAEGARWVVTGFVFGYLYSRLPGRTGPMKAMAYTFIWGLSAWAAVAIAYVVGNDALDNALYRTAEFAVFTIVLGISYDMWTIKAGGGGWRDLRQAYIRNNYVQVVVVLAPLLISIVTLISQVLAGAGFQGVNTLVNGIRDVVTAPITPQH